MPRRYLFLCPDSQEASGGVAVLYNSVQVLRQAGHDAVLVHNSPNAGHSDYIVDIPLFYTHEIRKASLPWAGRVGAVRDRKNMVMDGFVGAKGLDKLELRDSDIIVVPDFMLAASLQAFPGRTTISYVQNPFVYIEACISAQDRGLNPVGDVHWNLSMAKVCDRALELMGATRTSYFPVCPELDLFPFREDKKPTITFMPRKRPEEARLIEAALRKRGKIEGFELIEVDGVPRQKVAEFLGESLVFISLLKNESLGFPAAEAMAAGCIAVGYTGLTDEFFDDSTGVTVMEGDPLGVVEAVERTVAEYRQNPARLDAIRKHASEHIHATFSRDRFETGIKAAWGEIEGSLK